METLVERDLDFAADIWKACFGRGGDFTVVVEEVQKESAEVGRVEFKVWSWLLAKGSPVLDKMVNSGNFEESQTAQVVICDFSAAAVESFLRFLYSGVVEGSLLTLVEVAAVADKYQVHRLHALCVQACQHGLKPAMACAAFESADRLGLASIRRSAKEQILIHPGEALKDGQNLSPQLLSELLSSNLLCIENEALRRLLSAWGNQKKRKAAAMDDDSQQPIISRFMSELSNRRPAQHSTDVLKTLWDRYLDVPTGTRGVFIGHWVTLILGSPSSRTLNLAGVSFPNSEEHVRSLACNKDIPLRMQGSYVTWVIPHFSVYLSGFSFRKEVPSTVHFEVFCSPNGASWHRAMVSDKRRIAPGSVPACDAPDHVVKYFKLQVLEGEFLNNFCIHGILQAD